MNKKNIIIIISILVIGFIIAGLYNTFATSSTVTPSDNTYAITLTDEKSEVSIPANSTKTVMYKITNTNKGIVQYGITYTGTNISVQAWYDSESSATGNIDYGETKFIKLYIENSGDTESTATLSTILGYENGGNIKDIVPSDKKLVTSYYNPDITPISDFIYYLGSEYQEVDTISYYDEETDAIYDIPLSEPIPLESNEIFLVRYIGTSSDVNVPGTYVIDGETYNVTMLSYAYIYHYMDEIEIDTNSGVFMYNETVESVLLSKNIKIISYEDAVFENDATALFEECTNLINVPVFPDSVTSMQATFSGCTSLVNAPEIPSSVTDMYATFSGCTSLVNAPEIPSSVTNMGFTFSGCTSLVTAPEIPSSVTNMGYTFKSCTSLVNAPEIPSSVTNMYQTFYECTSLVTAPEIPSSVTNMGYTFSECTNLVTAPEIPSSVTSMSYIFSGCTSLTGIVRINSSNVSLISNIFTGTVNSITVEVPEGSTTYTNLSALTTSNGMPSNVELSTFVAG